MKQAFSYFDKDASGTISLDELKQCLASSDFTLPEETLTKLLNEVDANKDGLIDYNEFITMMKDNSEYSSSLFI